MITYNELTSPQAIAGLRDYLVLALRSTGPDPGVDRIFQLGMLRVENGEIVNRNSTLIDPGMPIPAGITEESGITDEDAARGLSYPQMAASLAKLLLDGVVIADEDALGFVRTMLEENGFGGSFSFVDVRAYLALEHPELAELDPAQIAEALEIRAEEAPGILQDAALRYALLQQCQRYAASPGDSREAPLPPASDAPDEAAEEADSSQTPPPSAGQKPEKTAKKGLFPLIRLKPRQAPRKKRRRRDRLEGVWDLSTEEFIGYGAALISAVAALIFLPSWASLLFLLAGLVFLPLRPVRRLFRRIGLDGWKILVLGAALFVLASVVKPHTPGGGRVKKADDGPPSFIILTWNEPGEYGEEWTALNDDGVEERYIAFHLPTGIYRVLNNNVASAKVTVCDDVPEEKSVDIQDLLLEESTRTVTVLASKSKEITLDEGQHLRLSEDADNVIFQYLGEIPEVVEEDKDEQEDPNATAITAWVNGTEVRMRKSASVSAFIMATFDTGKEVKVTGESGDWTAVTVDNQKGFIYSRYITYEKPAGVE